MLSDIFVTLLVLCLIIFILACGVTVCGAFPLSLLAALLPAFLRRFLLIATPNLLRALYV